MIKGVWACGLSLLLLLIIVRKTVFFDLFLFQATG